jgi:hypothetical protein
MHLDYPRDVHTERVGDLLCEHQYRHLTLTEHNPGRERRSYHEQGNETDGRTDTGVRVFHGVMQDRRLKHAYVGNPR